MMKRQSRVNKLLSGEPGEPLSHLSFEQMTLSSLLGSLRSIPTASLHRNLLSLIGRWLTMYPGEMVIHRQSYLCGEEQSD